MLVNQYPRAEYGQITDGQDHMFNVDLQDFEISKISDYNVIYARLLVDFYTTFKQNGNPEMIPHLKQIEDTMSTVYGKHFVEVPVFEKHPEVKHFVLKDITA